MDEELQGNFLEDFSHQWHQHLGSSHDEIRFHFNKIPKLWIPTTPSHTLCYVDRKWENFRLHKIRKVLLKAAGKHKSSIKKWKICVKDSASSRERDFQLLNFFFFTSVAFTKTKAFVAEESFIHSLSWSLSKYSFSPQTLCSAASCCPHKTFPASRQKP